MSARDLEGDATMETTVPNLQLSRHLQNCQQCLKCKVAFAPLKLSAVQISFSRWCYPEEEVGICIYGQIKENHEDNSTVQYKVGSPLQSLNTLP